MPFQVDGALVHATSGNELSRVRTEFRLILPRAYQAMPTRVESRHRYAIKFLKLSRSVVSSADGELR